ncbi:MAG TPA: branched-chain amino acid ABC transporter permease [Burkholderiales bacterium]|jgi:branched-chain amino acid transport system permease protein|nr:branched-chain amino acid ABC transporter permease [Burkholderiales bacterium]
MGAIAASHRARLLWWGGFAVLLVVLPLLFHQGFALTLLCQIGTIMIFALSYNMLLGQAGMLSFGHAVYAGLGAYIAIHTLNFIGKGTIVFPVTLLPLVGGLAGAFFGVLFGYVTTRKSGTPFAMITLGIGELVASMALMFPDFFGGEGGISTNRIAGKPLLGFITYGPQIQVYYLVAVWLFVCTAAMYAYTQTPLGRIANAVRDNPERAEFIGYETQRVRYLVLIISGFFAGVAGGLSAINFEIVSAENVSAIRSGTVLLFTYIGGVGFFFGPMIGSVLLGLFVVVLSTITNAWLLYLGLFFVLVVMYCPGGIAGLIMLQAPLVRAGRLRAMLPAYALAALAGVVLLAGLILAVEMLYYHALEADNTGPVMHLLGMQVNVLSVPPWAVVAVLAVAGFALLLAARRAVTLRWDRVMSELAAGASP